MPHTYWPLVAIAIGIVSGVSSGAFGIGGGVVNKPLLRVFLRATPGFVIGSPILAQFLGAALGSISYFKKRMINFRLVWLATPFAIAGTILGAWLTSFLNLGHVMVFLVLVVLWTGSKMIAKSFTVEAHEPQERTAASIYKVAPTAFAAGTVAGLLGVGGGFLLVPAFNIVLKREIKECIASSLVVVTLTAIPNGIIHWALGHIDWNLAFSLLVGQMIGVWFGTIFTTRSHRKLVYFLFGLFLIIVSLTQARLEILNILRGS